MGEGQRPSRFSAVWLLSSLLLIFVAGSAGAASVSGPAQEVELFVSGGCAHCAGAQAFLEGLAGERKDVRLNVIDVGKDARALARLQDLSRAAGVAQVGVPSIVIGSQLIVGFDTGATTGARIRAALENVPLVGSDADPACAVGQSCKAPEEAIEIPLIGGRISAETVGLPLFTLAIGLLDGFNPCSMWVLILMISMLAALRDRKKMLAIAGTFVAIEGIAYFAFMAAWLNVFLLIGLSRASQVAIALIAILAGMVNLKDFLMLGRGMSLSIPAAARPGIYARLRAILAAEKLWPALAGAAVLAVLVQLVELLCTSGFPALYTRILTLGQLDRGAYYGYLALYDAMYMADDLIVLAIGIVTLSQRRLQENEGRWLKLIAGLVMIVLGFYLLAAR